MKFTFLNKTIKNFIKGILVASLLTMLAVSCDDDSAPYYYRLTLQSGSNSSNGTLGTTQIFYSPNDKSWYMDTDGKVKLTPTEHPIDIPTKSYNVTLMGYDENTYKNPDYRPRPSQYEHTIPKDITKALFKGYKGYITESGHIEKNIPAIYKDTTVNADWGDVSVELPDLEDVSGTFEFVGWSPKAGDNATSRGDAITKVNGVLNVGLRGDETLYGLWTDSKVKTLHLIPWSQNKKDPNDHTTIADGDEGTLELFFKEQGNDKTWSESDTDMTKPIKSLNSNDLPKRRWQIVFKNEDGEPGVDVPSEEEMTKSISSWNREIEWQFDGYVDGNTTYIDASGNINQNISSSYFVDNNGKEITAVANWKWTNDTQQGNPSISFQAPTATGWRFTGFRASSGNVTQDGNTYTYVINDAVASSDNKPTITIEAMWKTNKVQSVSLESNGATDEPTVGADETKKDLKEGIFYNTSNYTWYTSLRAATDMNANESIKDGKVNPPKKVWNIEYVLNNNNISDNGKTAFGKTVEGKTSYEFTFNGYEVTNDEGASEGFVITSDGNIPPTWRPVRNSQKAIAKWTKPSAIELPNPESIETVKKDTAGWRFIGWRDSVDNSLITTNLIFNPDDDNDDLRNARQQSQKLIAEWEPIQYKVVVDGSDPKYYGSSAYPIVATKNIRINSEQTIEQGGQQPTTEVREGYFIRLNISDDLSIVGQDNEAKFNVSELTAKPDVSGWFSFTENGNSIVDDLKATVDNVTEKSVVIKLEGSFNSGATSGLRNGTILINPNNITNARFADNIVVNDLKYRVANVVTAEIAEKDDTNDYRGRDSDPLVAIPNEEVNALVKIKLTNAVFKDGLSTSDIFKWFSNISKWAVRDLSCEILSGGSATNEVVLRIKGTGMSSSSGKDDGGLEMVKRDVTIPTEHLKYGESKPSYNLDPMEFHYIKSNDVNVYIGDGSGYYGSSNVNPIVFVPNFNIGDDGTGAVVRLILTNKTFANNVLNGSTPVDSWFAALEGDSVIGSKLTYTVQQTSSQNVLEVKISGYTTKTTASSGFVQVVVPYTAIDGAIKDQGDKTVNLYYQINGTVGATLDESYKGTTTKPLVIPYGITTNNGDGEKIKIDLTAGAKFKKSLLNNPSVTTAWLEEVPDVINSVVAENISEDQTSLILNVKAYAKSTTFVASTMKWKIKYQDLENYALQDTEGTELVVNYGKGNSPQLKLVENTPGSSLSQAIRTIPYINIGENGNGVTIRLTLTDPQQDNRYKSDFRFAEGLTDDIVSTWFNSLENDLKKTVGGDNLKCEYVSGAGTNEVTIRLSGYATTPSISTVSTISVQLSNNNIKGGTTAVHIQEKNLYFFTDVVPVLTFANEGNYHGATEENALYLSETYFIGADGSKGILVKATLASGSFKETLSASDVEKWVDWDTEVDGVKFTLEDERDTFIDNSILSNDHKTVEFRIYGRVVGFSEGDVDEKQLTFVVPFTDIVNASNDKTWQDNNLTVKLHYKNSGEVTVISPEAQNRNYYGSEDHPITEPEKTYFNDSKGVMVRLNIKTGYKSNDGSVESMPAYVKNKQIRFKSSLATQDVTEWFNFGNAIKVDEITVESVATNGSYINLLLKGYFNSYNIDGWGEQYIPASAFENVPSLFRVYGGNVNETTGQVDDKTDTRNVIRYSNTVDNAQIDATISADEGYAGATADKALHGTPYTLFGSNNYSKRIKIQLKNAKFDNVLTNDIVATWMKPLSTAVNNMEIPYTIEKGTGAGQDNVIIVINEDNNKNGYPTIGGLDSSFIIDIPYNVLMNVSEDFDGKSLSVFYKTDAVETISLDANAPYDGGTIDRPILGTPYVNFAHTETVGGTATIVEGIKVKINLENTTKTFSSQVTSTRVKNWFSAFESGIGAKNALTYKLYDATGKEIDSGEKQQSIIVEIKGYPTEPNKIITSKITIGYEDIEGAVESFGNKDINLYFQTTPNVVASVVSDISDYYGSQGVPLVSSQYIAYGEDKENGLKARIKLENGKFDNAVLTPLLTKDISSIVNDSEKNTRTYTLLAVDAASSEYIDIKVTGYSNSVNTSSIPCDVTIPQEYIQNASLALSGNNAVSTALYFRSSGAVSSSISALGDFVGSSASSRLKGRPFINLGDSEGVKVRIELDNAKFAADFNDEMLKDIFSEFTKVYGELTYKIDTTTNGGADKAFVDVIIQGYPNIAENQIGNIPLNIKYKHIKASYTHQDGDTEDSTMISTSLYYATEDAVVAKLNTSSSFSMTDITPLGSGRGDGDREYQYMVLNGGNGVRIRIELTNGVFDPNMSYTEFAKALSDSINASLFKDAFKNIVCTVEGDAGAGTSTITLVVKGYAYKSASRVSNIPIYIPYNFIKDGGPREETGKPLGDDQKLKINGATYDTSTLQTVAVAPDNTGAYVGGTGAGSRRLIATRYMSIGAGGNGSTIMLTLTGAKFGGDLVAKAADGTEDVATTRVNVQNAVNTWLEPLTRILGGSSSTIKYEVISDVIGTGVHTNKLAIRVTGAPNQGATERTNGYASITIPFSALDNTGSTTNEAGTALNLQTSIYYATTDDIQVTLSGAEGYYGTEDKPIIGTPFVNMGDGEGLKVMLTLNRPQYYQDGKLVDIEQPVFSKGITANDVTTWFNALSELKTADAQSINYYKLKYSIDNVLDGDGTTVDSSSVVVRITGYPQQAELLKNSVNITVPMGKVKNAKFVTGGGTTEPTMTTPINYQSYGAVTISATNTSFRAFDGVYIGHGNGQEVQVTVNNAKFAKLTEKDIQDTWLSEIASEYMKISGTDKTGIKIVSQDDDINASGAPTTTLTLLLKGYLIKNTTDEYSSELKIQPSNIANATSELAIQTKPQLTFRGLGPYGYEANVTRGGVKDVKSTVEFIDNVYVGEDYTITEGGITKNVRGIVMNISNAITYYRSDLRKEDVINWLAPITKRYSKNNSLSYDVVLGDIVQTEEGTNARSNITISISGYPEKDTTAPVAKLIVPASDTVSAVFDKEVLFNINEQDRPNIRMNKADKNKDIITITKGTNIASIADAEAKGYYFNVSIDKSEFISSPASSGGIKIATQHRVVDGEGSGLDQITADYYLVTTDSSNLKVGKVYIVGTVDVDIQDDTQTSSTFQPIFEFDETSIKNLRTGASLTNGIGVTVDNNIRVKVEKPKPVDPDPTPTEPTNP